MSFSHNDDVLTERAPVLLVYDLVAGQRELQPNYILSTSLKSTETRNEENQQHPTCFLPKDR